MNPRRQPPALTPAAGIVGWLALVAALNLTTHPVVSAGAFAGLALTAWRSGHLRLIGLSLLVGLGLLLMVPGLAFTSGAWSLSFAPQTALPTGSLAGIGYGAMAMLRVPAQVLATVLLMLVPTTALLGALGRVSPRTALVAGMATRLGPLLRRDVAQLRDELRVRGARFGAPAPVAERFRSIGLLWEALVSGLFDRAFDTAAALRVRGHGAQRSTGGSLPVGAQASQAPNGTASALLVVLGVALVTGVVAGRVGGWLATPWIRVLAGVEEPVTAGAIVLGVIAFAAGAVPLFASRRWRDAAPGFVHGAKGAASVGTQTPVGPARAGPALTGRGNRSRAASPDDAAVVGRGLGVRYPGAGSPSLQVPVLELARGSLTAVVGASGSGKSSLLAVLTRTVPDHLLAGTVTIGGADVATMLPGPRVTNVGAVFQDPERQSVLDAVVEEVALGPRNAGLPIDAVAERAAAALHDVGIAQLAGRRCAELSGGELQLVMLAAALAPGPRVLVLDEPTSQLDATAAHGFWAALERARATLELTVLVAEHRLHPFLPQCDRVLLLDAGAVVFDGSPDEAAECFPGLGEAPYTGLAAPRGAGAGWRRAGAHGIGTPVVAVAGLDVRAPRRDRGRGTGAAPPPLLVRGLSFTLEAGAIAALTGANGSGKSTLLRVLRGLAPAAAGACSVRGVWVDPRQLAVVPAAFVSQQGSLLLTTDTVLAAVAEAGPPVGSWPGGSTARHAWVLETLADAGLDHLADRHPQELSAGERQRLTIICSTLAPTPVWILDEPTRGMDQTARRWLSLRLLRHAAAGGVSILATHDEGLVAAVCTHRIGLAGGNAACEPLVTGLVSRPDDQGVHR